jgi:hypothetical protein
MSDQEVDFSQIRGDWFFHMNYLINALEQTQKRQAKLWRQVKAARNDNGALPVDQDHLMEDFIDAVRMTNSFMDDLIMMQEQRPDSAKKGTKKAAKKKPAKKKAKKKVAKKATKKKVAKKPLKKASKKK